jgi:hypothetical protein
MKVSYVEGLANHNGPESCGAAREGGRRSIDRGKYGPGIQPRKELAPGCRRCKEKRKAPPEAPISRGASRSRAVTDPVHVPKHLAWEPGDPAFTPDGRCLGTHREV